MERRAARACAGDTATPAVATPATAAPTVATPAAAAPVVATRAMATRAAAILTLATPGTTTERPPSDLIIWSPFAEILLGDEITGVAAGGDGETRFDGIFVRRRPCGPYRRRAAG